jgi:acetolactate synthase-1/2/3 large subunit
MGALERLGVSQAFGMPGMWSLPIYEALRCSKVNHILVRHEQFAAYAADGYARASGRPACCIGTAGQGAVNIASGVAVAYRDHSPVIALTGQVPTYELGLGWIEDLDQQAIFRPVTKSTMQISDPEKTYGAITHAYKSSMEGCPGPAHVGIPGDLQGMPSCMGSRLPKIMKASPDQALLEAAADAVLTSHSPLILAGWGAVLSGSAGKLVELAESIQAPVVTSLMGRGAVPEDSPVSLGPVGRRGNPSANQALSSCDLLLALGCRLTNMTVDVPLNCRIVQVDVCAAHFSPRASVKVESDISLFIEGLLPRIRPSAGRSQPRPPAEPLEPSERSYAFAKVIASFSEAVFSLDIGQNTIWMMRAIRAKRPRQVIFSGNMSAMGFSLPAAIGAKVALPERMVIAVTGDGGFQMAASELSTVRENGLNVAVCVFNNRSLGLIRQLQERVYSATHGVNYSDPPSYTKLAEAHGIRGMVVDTPSDLQDALRSADEPLVIEIPLPREEDVDMPRLRLDGS